MSLYTDGTHVTLPTAWPIPGKIDPTLTKLYDVAIPGGPPINLDDYTSPEEVEQPQAQQVQRQPIELGDNHIMNANPALQQKHVTIPTKDYSIPTKRLLAVRDWR